jgi:hypothetical protein
LQAIFATFRSRRPAVLGILCEAFPRADPVRGNPRAGKSARIVDRDRSPRPEPIFILLWEGAHSRRSSPVGAALRTDFEDRNGPHHAPSRFILLLQEASAKTDDPLGDSASCRLTLPDRLQTAKLYR